MKHDNPGTWVRTAVYLAKLGRPFAAFTADDRPVAWPIQLPAPPPAVNDATRPAA